MNKDDYITKINKVLSNKTQFQKVSLNNNIANLFKFQRFLYNLKTETFHDQKFTIKLDLLQLLLLHFMVCRNYTKKDIHVGIS